jgi:hypothetical protein
MPSLCRSAKPNGNSTKEAQAEGSQDPEHPDPKERHYIHHTDPLQNVWVPPLAIEDRDANRNTGGTVERREDGGG